MTRRFLPRAHAPCLPAAATRLAHVNIDRSSRRPGCWFWPSSSPWATPRAARAFAWADEPGHPSRPADRPWLSHSPRAPHPVRSQPAAAQPADSAASPTLPQAPQAPAAAPAEAPADFASQAQLLYRVVACGDAPDVELPPDWVPVVNQHCASLARQIAHFRRHYVDKATPFLARLRPSDLPTTVVYPFGGGDLASALVAYPDALDVTTISLEQAGDPRHLAGLSAAELRRSLADFRTAIRGLLALHDSATDKMQAVQRGPLPGQISFFMTALSVFGDRPVSMRFFRVEPDGSLHYYTPSEIDALAQVRATKSRKWVVGSDDSIAFSNVELVFMHGTQRVVHRHVAANLDNKHFHGSGLEKFLEAKGDVSALTKAASYLLWSNGFSAIRSYLTGHAVFMVSDSTGIPPLYARRAHLRQITYGRFTGAYLTASEIHGKAFTDLWAAQPYRHLSFRFGYPDAAGNFHLLITRRKAN